MDYIDAILAIKKQKCEAIAVDFKTKTIFFMDYDNKDKDRFSEVIIYVIEECGVEECYSPEGLIEEFKNVDELNFFLVENETINESFGLMFEYALIEIEKGLIQ